MYIFLNYFWFSCFNNYLSSKIRILVTHQVHFLTNVAKIIVLDNGEIKFIGNFNQLVKFGVNMEMITQNEYESTNKMERKNSLEIIRFKRTLSNASKYSYDSTSDVISEINASNLLLDVIYYFKILCEYSLVDSLKYFRLY